MADLTLDIAEESNVNTITPTMTMTTPAELPPLIERSPCNWAIEWVSGNTIRARSRLGDRFEGSISDFNELLRL